MRDIVGFPSKVWRVIRTHRLPLRFFVAKALVKSGFSKCLMIRQRGFRLRFYPSSLSAALWIDPYDRQGDEHFLRSYLKLGDVVIDVGANIGQLSLIAADVVGTSGHVYAFEPHPRTFKFLEGNLILNKTRNVTATRAAIGETVGTLRLSDGFQDDGNRVECRGAVVVPVQSLDSIPFSESAIDLLKIDVEGFELFVLKGAANVLSRVKCVLLESWDGHFSRYGYDARDVLRYLDERGYRIYRREEGCLVQIHAREHKSGSIEELAAFRDGEEERLANAYNIVPRDLNLS